MKTITGLDIMKKHRRVTPDPGLFDAIDPPRHDPGGKVKTRLPPGMTGRALFRGEQDEHRIWLWRGWGPDLHLDKPYPLLLGMNPSTADDDGNDSTINREIDFVKSWGYDRFFKGNVGSIRLTDQKDIIRRHKIGLSIVHDDNVPTLRALANSPKCDKIVLCCGKVPPPLLPVRDVLVSLLRADGHTIWCFGLTPKTGHPRHPLYLPKTTSLIEYTP